MAELCRVVFYRRGEIHTHICHLPKGHTGKHAEDSKCPRRVRTSISSDPKEEQ